MNKNKTAKQRLTGAQLRMLRSLALTGHTDGTAGTIAALERRGLVCVRQRDGAPQGHVEAIITAAGLQSISERREG
jgi:hypothetical protein